jgi:hypothetical protein
MSDQRHAMRKMHDALFLQFDFMDSDSVSMLPVSKKRFLPPERRKKAIASLGFDLCLISADTFFAGLRRHFQHKHRYSEEFSFFMCMLDRAIKDALAEENEKTKEQILTKLPTEYHNFANVFSKVESSALPPHRPIDHKVELLPDTAPLKAYPLYSMSADQLVALRDANLADHPGVLRSCHGTRPYGQGRHLESGYWLWVLAIHHQHEDPPAMHHQHEDPQRPTESSRAYSITPQLRTYGYIRETVSMYSRFPFSFSSALE